MELIFKDQWHHPHGGGYCYPYYRMLNDIEADIFISVTYYPEREIKPPKNFKKCLEFVGGFTDETFFNKEEIEKLSKEDQGLFLDYIKKQSEALSDLYT